MEPKEGQRNNAKLFAGGGQFAMRLTICRRRYDQLSPVARMTGLSAFSGRQNDQECLQSQS